MTKTAPVTGAGRGLGRSAALSIARHGDDVVLTYQSRGEDAQAAVAEIAAMGRKTVAFQFDIALDPGLPASLARMIWSHCARTRDHLLPDHQTLRSWPTERPGYCNGSGLRDRLHTFVPGWHGAVGSAAAGGRAVQHNLAAPGRGIGDPVGVHEAQPCCPCWPHARRGRPPRYSDLRDGGLLCGGNRPHPPRHGDCHSVHRPPRRGRRGIPRVAQCRLGHLGWGGCGPAHADRCQLVRRHVRHRLRLLRRRAGRHTSC